jgi:hypothetical protein
MAKSQIRKVQPFLSYLAFRNLINIRHTAILHCLWPTQNSMNYFLDQGTICAADRYIQKNARNIGEFNDRRGNLSQNQTSRNLQSRETAQGIDSPPWRPRSEDIASQLSTKLCTITSMNIHNHGLKVGGALKYRCEDMSSKSPRQADQQKPAQS